MEKRPTTIGANELFAMFKQLAPDSQQRVLAAMLSTQAYLTDSQVCALLQINDSTLRRWLREGPPATKPDAIDLRLAQPVTIGGQRRWDREKLQQLLN